MSGKSAGEKLVGIQKGTDLLGGHTPPVAEDGAVQAEANFDAGQVDAHVLQAGVERFAAHGVGDGPETASVGESQLGFTSLAVLMPRRTSEECLEEFLLVARQGSARTGRRRGLGCCFPLLQAPNNLSALAR